MHLREPRILYGGSSGPQNQAVLTVNTGHAVGAATQSRVLRWCILLRGLRECRLGVGVCPGWDVGDALADQFVDIVLDHFLALSTHARMHAHTHTHTMSKAA